MHSPQPARDQGDTLHKNRGIARAISNTPGPERGAGAAAHSM